MSVSPRVIFTEIRYPSRMRPTNRRTSRCRPRASGLWMWRVRLASILLISGPLGLSGCGTEPIPQHPNVLFIVVDTLRADHLGSYGHHRPTSPAIDALARDAIRFERAYASAPWTKPSVASMFTGLHPSSHTVLHLESSLPDSAKTLAERLRDAGFATGAVISHHVIGREYGFDQGFAYFLQDQGKGHRHSSTQAVTQQAEDLLDVFQAQAAPFFLFVHYFDPHFVYHPHPEFGFAGERPERIDWKRSIVGLRLLDPSPNVEEIGYLEASYDEEIRYTDSGIGRLLDSLRARGLYDDALIIFTSDHGEEFFEHGWLGHTISVNEELVRVPLIIRPPGGPRQGRVVEQPVSLVSLSATVLEVAGVAAEVEFLQEGSLTQLWSGGGSNPAVPVFAEVDFAGKFKSAVLSRRFEAKHDLAVISGRYKLVVDKQTGASVLYDVVRDPTEDHDIASNHPQRTARLLALAEAHLARVGQVLFPSEEHELSDEHTRLLQGLGYLEE